MGDPPLLAQLGQLERIILAQAAASDPWKQSRDEKKRQEQLTALNTAAGAGASVSRPTSAPVSGRSGDDLYGLYGNGMEDGDAGLVVDAEGGAVGVGGDDGGDGDDGDMADAGGGEDDLEAAMDTGADGHAAGR